MKKISIPVVIQQIMATIASNGKTSYIVGGFVRDALMDKPTNDIDIATDAHPSDIQQWLHHEKLDLKGIKYGCISFNKDGYTIEITTMRKDSPISNGRQPESIEYTHDLTIDALRRDFTINALYLDQDGTIIDPTGGIDDLNHHTIRSVMDPHVSFDQDHLRLLRALRLMATTGFGVEPVTKKALMDKLPLIKSLSSYRIGSELNKLLVQPYSYRLMDWLDQLISMISGLTIPLTPLVPSLQDLHVIYALLFSNYTKDQIKWVASRLNLSASMVNTIIQLIPLLPHGQTMSIIQVKSLAALKPSSSILDDFNTLTGLDIKDEVDHYQKMDIVLHQKQIHLTTNDMARLGIAFHDYRHVYRYLLYALYENKVKNNKDQLMDYIKTHRQDIKSFISSLD